VQWTFPQLSIFIIYISTLSILIQWIRALVISYQFDLINTRGSILPVCDKFITRTKRKGRKGRRLKCLRIGALLVCSKLVKFMPVF